MVDKLAAIEVFEHVAQCGSFTAASRSFRRTPSSLTKIVDKLEQHLKVRLIDRTTHGLKLTDEGVLLYSRCRTLLDYVRETEDLLADRRGSVAGTVRIGALAGIGRRLIVPALPSFFATNPGIKIELELSEVSPDFQGDRLDVALVVGLPPEGSRLVAKVIGATRRITVAAPCYLEAHGRPELVEDIDSHRCLVHVFDQKPIAWRFTNAKNNVRSLAPRPFLAINSGDTLLEAAIAGLGLAQSNSLLFDDDIKGGRLVEVLKEAATPGLPIGVVRTQSRPVPQRIRIAAQFLESLFG